MPTEQDSGAGLDTMVFREIMYYSESNKTGIVRIT